MAVIKSIGKHAVSRTLGQGAHSTIYQIRRDEDAREYALKVVEIADKDELKFYEQLKFEHRVAGMLDHPNIIKLHCLETEKTWLMQVKKANLLVEFVNGKTLDELPVMPFPKLVHVFRQIAAGLAHMHRRGVFHADMKPNNVMLSRGGQVKIIDLGLAWIKGEPKDRVQGTPEYMAPETAKAKVVNELTDIYNFGATMYRLTTWKLPPAALSGGQVIHGKEWKALYQKVATVQPNAPGSLGELIDQCCQYKPEQRPERMTDIAQRLEDIQAEVGEPED